MTLTATASIPGYDITPDATGTQLFFKYGIGAPGDNLAESMSGRLDGQSVSNAGPHTITVSDGTVFNLPSKQWRTHFRYPWVSDKVIVTPAQLVARRLCFPFGNPGGAQPLVEKIPAPPAYNDPNAFPNMFRSENSTGFRLEIDLLTEWSARFMATGDSDGMMQEADAAGTEPVFYIDNATGKFFNKLPSPVGYPSANFFSFGPQYWGRPWVPATQAGGQLDITMAANHKPELSYIPALVTQNTWHLINLQASACWYLSAIYSVDANGNVSVAVNSEQRTTAWGGRTVGMAHIATLEFERLGIPLPPECFPSSYFKTFLDNMLVPLTALMNDPENQVARVLPCDNSGAMAPWQQCYINQWLAWMVLTGHTGYNALYLWHLQGIISLTSGKDGWPVPMPCPYWVYFRGFKTIADMWDGYKLPVGQGPGAQLGTGGTLVQAALDTCNADMQATVLAEWDNEGDYHQETRQCLMAASFLQKQGILNVLATCPDLTASIANIMAITRWMEAKQNPWIPGRNWFFNWRTAVVDDPSVAPTTILQPTPVAYLARRIAAPPPSNPPPPTQPPAGALHMAGTGNLNVGQIAQVLLTFDDGKGNPSEAPTNLVYSESPPGVVTVAADSTGVNVTAVAPGNFTVTAAADGGLTTSISGTVALPLAGALHLAWA